MMLSHCPSHLHVLIVDDLPQITHPLAVLLRHDGCRVTVSNRVHTFSEVQELQPDLIIHDLVFAHSQRASLAFLRELRSEPTLPRIPVLLYTLSHRSVMDAAVADELRALGVLLIFKPCPLAMLLNALDEARVAAQIPAPRQESVTTSLISRAAS